MLSFLYALGTLVLVFIWLVYLNYRAYTRAIKRGVVGYKHGMAVDENGCLLGTSTPVYRDPKSGATFFGETIYGTDGGF
jgi:hypothetical protein